MDQALLGPLRHHGPGAHGPPMGPHGPGPSGRPWNLMGWDHVGQALIGGTRQITPTIFPLSLLMKNYHMHMYIYV